jgi:hypothetical protein
MLVNNPIDRKTSPTLEPNGKTYFVMKIMQIEHTKLQISWLCQLLQVLTEAFGLLPKQY